MENFIKNIPGSVKGMFFIIAGIILLLNTLGITMKVIHYSMFLGALILIIYGIIETGLYQKLFGHSQDK